MDIPKNLSLNAQTLILGNRSLDSNTEQVNIISSNGTEVKINGVVPGGGGDNALPITGTGDISITGNIRANGDGITTGKLEGEIVKATSGNIIASLGNIVATAGNITASATGPGQGQLSGVTAVISNDISITGNGSLTLNGNGDISVLGTGNIGVGTGGIISTGDINTVVGDIVSAGDYYFEGDDIYHREVSGFPPQVVDTSYVNFKQLPQLNAGNTFTGANKFNSNPTEFAEKVSVGTRDGGGLFTQTIALNKSGNIECQTLQNVTDITTGTINCDNGGTNSCAAKTFTTRTSGPAGWTIEQQPAEGNALDNVLQMVGGQPGAYITINDSAFAGFVPNISLNPQTSVLGGLIQTDNFRIGDGANSFDILQPKSGADANNLLIKSGAANTPIKFQNNAGTTDLMTLELEAGPNDGLLKVPAIEFGTTGTHNRIYQLQSGPTNLNLNIKQATASSEVVFLDNADSEIIRIQKTQVELGNSIPLLFGNYSFRPQQYSLTNASFPIEATEGSFTKIFTSSSSFTNVNTGSTGATLTEGFYKLSVSQTGASTPNGNYENLGILCDYVYRIPAYALPNNQLPNSLSFSYKQYLTSGAPEIEIRRNALGAQDVHLTFPTSGTGGESMSILVKLTKMDY